VTKKGTRATTGSPAPDRLAFGGGSGQAIAGPLRGG